jgi:hypothetical protein
VPVCTASRWQSSCAQWHTRHFRDAREEAIVEGVTTILFLLLLVLVLQTLGLPVAGPRPRATSWSKVGRRLLVDVVAGVRVLSRLDAARRDRLGRPWS